MSEGIGCFSVTAGVLSAPVELLFETAGRGLRGVGKSMRVAQAGDSAKESSLVVMRLRGGAG